MGVSVAESQRHHRSKSLATRQTATSSRIRHGRAINAVAAYLRSSLRVPLIYLEPKLRAVNGEVDVLAIDAAGSGDIHVAEIKIPNSFASSVPNLRAYISRLRSLPSHYKWLVLPRTEATEGLATHPSLFASDGLGRVGILLVSEVVESHASPQAEVLVKAERFRVSSEDIAIFERYMNKHKPDIEVRI